MIIFWVVVIVFCVFILIRTFPFLIIGEPIQCDNGSFMYVFIHEKDFTALKHFEGKYPVGRQIQKTDEHMCWGNSKKDAQERITKLYDTEYPMHPRPIVIKRVMD